MNSFVGHLAPIGGISCQRGSSVHPDLDSLGLRVQGNLRVVRHSKTPKGYQKACYQGYDRNIV